MFKAYLASFRLAVALVCIGASLIIGAISLGLIPDESTFVERSREEMREGIALTAAMLVRDQKPVVLSRVLRVMVDQNHDLVKIEIDTGNGLLQAADSRTTDPAAVDHAPADETQQPIGTYALPRRVPLELGGVTYGTANFYHRYIPEPTWLTWARLPLVRLIAFFVVAGVGVYTVFVIQMMRSFEITQVIPNHVRQALDTLPDGLLVMDQYERIVLANQSFSKMVGLSQEKLQGRRARWLPWVCSASSAEKDYPWVRAVRESKPQTEQLMTFRLPDGNCLDFSINSTSFVSPGSKLRGVLATFRDVTESEKHLADCEQAIAVLQYSQDEISTKNRELEILATQDSLTGCMNRRSFTAAVETEWHEARRLGTPITCLMIDHDHFKNVNDRYGHHVGDEVLRQVSQVLKNSFPHPSIVCRYGGEEYCVCLPQTTLEEAQQKAETARRRIEAIRLDDPDELRVSVSIGGSDSQFGSFNSHELINQADEALYVAKRNGRNQVVVYGDSVFESSIECTTVRDHPGMRAAEATELPFQAVTALVSALAYRDSRTAEHSRRVSDLCVRLASGILDERDTHILEIAGLLHDIGKIGVPDNVLLKPGPLTEDEWKLMRQHDRIGVDIAASTFNCEELSELIRTHHAFFGGVAHNPSLPSGPDIPLAARLLTLADGYDAMVTDRVYRAARSHDEAIAELRRSAGTQFDPDLVEHFATVVTPNQSVADETANWHPEQIGFQIKQLADALDSRNLDGIQTFASRVGVMARHHQFESVAAAAEQLESAAAQEDVQWVNVLRDTKQLLKLCTTSRGAALAEETDTPAEPVTPPSRDNS